MKKHKENFEKAVEPKREAELSFSLTQIRKLSLTTWALFTECYVVFRRREKVCRLAVEIEGHTKGFFQGASAIQLDGKGGFTPYKYWF